MRTILLAFVFGVLLSGPAFSQALVTKEGKSIPVKKIRRDGETIMATIEINGADGEAGYPVANIDRLDWPEPEGIREGMDLVSRGKGADAIAKLDSVMSYFESFKDLPGNWWAQAAIIKTEALLALGKSDELSDLSAKIQKSSTNPVIVLLAKTRAAASMIEKGDRKKAVEILEAISSETTRPEVLAEVWLNKGRALLANEDFEPALLAYLQIPTFYGTQKQLMPLALMGSARAYVGLNDIKRANDTLQEIVDDYPASGEAVIAKKELGSK
jgi:tetratricopeptide (TPR) repeat protein